MKSILPTARYAVVSCCFSLLSLGGLRAQSEEPGAGDVSLRSGNAPYPTVATDYNRLPVDGPPGDLDKYTVYFDSAAWQWHYSADRDVRVTLPGGGSRLLPAAKDTVISYTSPAHE
ncbi:MAG: hypothetical protein ACAI35_25745 [Candidatus Methylacidiphilales bacterium]|nr:hypothetical protein [Candidatus Methylacidiphilales bacterium]